MDISKIVIKTSGTASASEFDNVTWRLAGPDATPSVVGTVTAGRITFNGLSIKVSDGASETYTINAFQNDTAGLAEGSIFCLSIDGDQDVTFSGGTTIGNSSPASNSVLPNIRLLQSPPQFDRVRSYKDIYLIISQWNQLKYQVSFSYQVLRYGDTSFLRRAIGDIGFAYSVKAFGGGLDLTEYNHNLELFFERDFSESDWGGKVVANVHKALAKPLESFRIGIWEHESDGRDGDFVPQTASWDRQYLSLKSRALELGGIDLRASLKVWRLVDKNKPYEALDPLRLWKNIKDLRDEDGSLNDDGLIDRSFGRYEFNPTLTLPSSPGSEVPFRLQVGFLLRGIEWFSRPDTTDAVEPGALRIDVKWALPWQVNPILYLQAFRGYGESINEHSTFAPHSDKLPVRVRAGVLLKL